MKLAVLALTILGVGCEFREQDLCACNPWECNQPVCGSDLNTYKCQCALNCHNLKADPPEKVRKMHDGACVPDCGCKPDPRGPLCATDLKTYVSECVLNCNHPHLKVMYQGPCVD